MVKKSSAPLGVQGKAHSMLICRPLRADLRKVSNCPESLELLTFFRASTKSLAGSILDPYIENGRRYANADYFLPDDDAEETRLGVLHQVFYLLLGHQLTMSRVPDSIKRILDIGTGPGNWAVAMGERYPNAEIVATDISSYQQPTNVPRNVKFQVDDAREHWTYAAPFDLIHIRGLSGAFVDWAHIYAEAFKHLRPGGMLEIADCGPIQAAAQPENSYLSIYNGAIQSAAEKAGITLGVQHQRKELVEGSGLSILKSTSREIPLGDYSPDPRMKVVGKMALVAALEGLESTSLRLLTRELNWEPEKVNDLCAKVANEIISVETRASCRCQLLLARKLLELE